MKFRCAKDAIKAERAYLYPATSHSKVNGEKKDSEQSEESTFDVRSPTVGGCRDSQHGFWESESRGAGWLWQ